MQYVFQKFLVCMHLHGIFLLFYVDCVLIVNVEYYLYPCYIGQRTKGSFN